MRLTKSFVENRWYRRTSPGRFNEIPREETEEGPPLDQQIKAWVQETGHTIIHPGQLGMHTTWHGDKDDPYQLKCLTFGLTVLYQEEIHGRQQPTQHADPSHIDPGANATNTSAPDPRGWGNNGGTFDGPGSP